MATVRLTGAKVPRLLLGRKLIFYIGHGLSEAMCVLNVLYSLKAIIVIYLYARRIYVQIQSDSGGKVSILRGDSIGHVRRRFIWTCVQCSWSCLSLQMKQH